MSESNETARFAFNLSVFEVAKKAAKRGKIVIVAWNDFKLHMGKIQTTRVKFDFLPAEIHHRNEPNLAKKQAVLSSLHGKIAIFA